MGLGTINLIPHASNERSPIVIYDAELLPLSQTFVRSQSEGLQQFSPYYIGQHRVDGLHLSAERVYVLNSGQEITGRLRELLWASFGIAPGLFRYARNLSPVLIHAHFGPGGVAALPLARRLRIPLIVTFHGYDATQHDSVFRQTLAGRLYLYRRHLLIKEASLFIAVSDFIRLRLQSQGYAEKKIVKHYIGVDTELFHHDEQVAREPVVLFVGRLVEKKGCEYLIRAMQLVQEQLPRAKVVIVGDGPLRDSLERQASRALTRYTFTGAQPAPVIRQWMNRAKVLAVPSVTAQSGDAEGLPMVIYESLAMGLPVVASFSAGIPEAVSNDENGFIVPERGVSELAHKIVRLMSDDLLWQRLSLGARQTALAKFDLSKQTAVLEQLYARVLEQHRHDEAQNRP